MDNQTFILLQLLKMKLIMGKQFSDVKPTIEFQCWNNNATRKLILLLYKHHGD